jgi:hypothetical protein
MLSVPPGWRLDKFLGGLPSEGRLDCRAEADDGGNSDGPEF